MYSPSPENDLRLLYIKYEQPEYFELLTYNLKDAPEFNASSYTWGSPLGGEEHGRAYDVEREITVMTIDNGKEVYHKADVKRNLYEALEALGGQQLLLWCDAICINQADLEEKSQQVAFMADIYARATVLVWLGVDDGIYHDLVRIHTYELDSIQRCQRASHDIVSGDCIDVSRADIKFTANAPWKLYGTRRWSNRAWATQEILLTKDIWVIDPPIHFSRIAEMARLIHTGDVNYKPSPTNGSSGTGAELAWVRTWLAHMRPDGKDEIAVHAPDYFSQICFFIRSGLLALSFCRNPDNTSSWIPDYTRLPPTPYGPEGGPWPLTPGPAAIYSDRLHLYGRKISDITSFVALRPPGDGVKSVDLGHIEAFNFYQGDYTQFLCIGENTEHVDEEAFENALSFALFYCATHSPGLLDDFMAAVERLPIELNLEDALQWSNRIRNESTYEEASSVFLTRTTKLKIPVYITTTRLPYTAGLYGRIDGPLRSGDELWLIRGARIPFVLRRIGGSSRIVAAAYVPYAIFNRPLESGELFPVGEIEESIIE